MSGARATVGVLLAGAALLLSAVVWTGTARSALLVGGAILAFLAFSGRRHGIVRKNRSVIAAGLGGVVVILGGLSMFVDGDPGSFDRIVTGVLVGLGGFLIALAAAEYREIPPNRLMTGSQYALVGAALGFGGLVVAGVLGSVPGLIVEHTEADPGAIVEFALSQTAIAIGFVLAVGGFIVLSGRTFRYIDVRRPTPSDLGYMLGGTIVVLIASAGIQFVLVAFGVEFATHQVEDRAAQHGPGILVVAIVFAFVTNGLGEELLFRNGVQKFLTEWFSPAAAIVLSSIVFALVHFPAYGSPAPLATLGSVFVVFSLSLILGITYYRTQNILVPIVIHGCYNAIVWIVVYVNLFV